MIVGISIFGILVLSVIIVLNHPAFGRTPRGERQERIEHSPNYKDGQFVNKELTLFMTSSKSRWRIMWDNLTEKKPENLAPAADMQAVKTDSTMKIGGISIHCPHNFQWRYTTLMQRLPYRYITASLLCRATHGMNLPVKSKRRRQETAACILSMPSSASL